MDYCLLCLEINNDFIDNIKVNSTQWHEENIKQLIHKHLWTMDTIQPSSWLCTSCWQELHNFHKFYMRIEETHMNLVTIIEESEDKTHLADQKHLSDDEDIEEYKYCIDTNDAADAFESDFSSKDIDNDIVDSGRDPLNERKEIQKYIIKDQPNAFEISEDIDMSIDSNHNSDTDSEYRQNEPFSESKSKQLTTREENDNFIAENFPLSCDLCQISLGNFTVLRTHFTEKHNTYGYAKCCGKKFHCRTSLVDHINIHFNPDFFKCEYCDKVLSSRIILEKHIKTHKDVQQKFYYSCNICGKQYKQQSQFENHKLKHGNEQKEFPCTDCGRCYDSSKKLGDHRRVFHLNKYVKMCEICGKTLHDRNTFITHMNIHENKRPPPVNCDICGIRLVDMKGLRGHKRRLHPVDGITEYPCHLCPKISPNKKSLRSHIRFAHEVGFIHKCTMCDKAFKRSESLKEHIATHSGTPLYTCTWCPKTFNSSANKNKHRKSAHFKEWEEERLKKYATTN